MFLHTEEIFLCYSFSVPNISDFSKKVLSYIDVQYLSLQLFLCTWIFNNSYKTLSCILTNVSNKQRLNKLMFNP